MTNRIETLTSDRLSTFRTRHQFKYYAEFKTIEEFKECLSYAFTNNLSYYIIGNGSNTLFSSPVIKTLVLKNKLDRDLVILDEHRVQINSSAPIAVLLRHCLTRQLDCFYYLASVPATVGGAIAMNAGRGRQYNLTIFDFIESVTFFNGKHVITKTADDIPREYRWTPFTGQNNQLILSAVFCFPPMPADGGAPVGDVQIQSRGKSESGLDQSEDNEFTLNANDVNEGMPDKIRERMEYSRRVQDYSAPNCGSVFKEFNGKILSRLRGLKFFGALYSHKKTNWLLNTSKHPRGLVWLVLFATIVHRISFKRIKLEIIKIK